MNKLTNLPDAALSFDKLYSELQAGFSYLPDHRRNNRTYSLVDVVSSAFAMFSLKSSSLLDFSFRSQQEESNLLSVYQIHKLCSDSQMREILDKVSASSVRALLSQLVDKVAKRAFFTSYRYWKQLVVISIDGVEHFSSQKVHCPHCLHKQHKSGEVTYSHAMLAAVMVHPDKREVVPLDAQPILQQDGCEKNDCERNAAKRLIEHLRAAYPKLQALLVEDALYANAPHIEQILQAGYHYLIGVKPDSHKALFKQANARRLTRGYVYEENKVSHQYEWVNNLPLCSSQSHIRVNFLRYQQRDQQGNLLGEFTWITDIPIRKNNVLLLSKAARARWKIENETFNTLKNQGYHRVGGPI